MPLTHDIGVRIPYPLHETSQVVGYQQIARFRVIMSGQIRDKVHTARMLIINIIHFCDTKKSDNFVALNAIWKHDQ